MPKLVHASALLVALFALSVPATIGVAQDAKKAAKAKDDKKATKPGSIVITEGKDEKFRFTIRDADGKLLAMSGPTGFATKEDAAKAVDTLKEVLEISKVSYGKKKEADDKDEPKKKKK